jgi:HSP20 family protein
MFMSAITRWDPFRELDELQNRLNTMFGRAPVKKEGERQEALRVSEWAPVVDITEDSKEYLIKAEIPGISKDQVKVSVQNDVLSISGERKYEKEEKDKKYHRIERAYGSFSRSFTIPEDADPEKVSADFQNGLLHVHLPKTERAKPKSIEVKVS